MSVVKINALEVPPERAGTLEERFRRRAGEVDTVDGFEAFELLRPTGGGTRWFVYTRWASEEAFTAWRESRAFERGHAGQAEGPPAASDAELLEFDVVLRSPER